MGRSCLLALIATPLAFAFSHGASNVDALRLDAEGFLSTGRGREPVQSTALLPASSPQQDPDVPYDLFIVIPSAADERDRRDAIRQTWAKYITSSRCRRCAQSKVGYRFVVGNESDLEASHREAAEVGDLSVLEDFGQQERYTKRSEKTFRTIRYAVQNFDFKFLLKCDTDSWVFVDRLLGYFDSHQFWEKSRLYAGNFRAGVGAMARSDPENKWFDPVYPEVTGLMQYPKHAKGAGYILSRALAAGVSVQPIDFWEYVPSEDVAVGFWLSAVHKEVEDIPVEIQKTCAEDTVIDHYITPETMRERWRTYEQLGTPCLSLPANLPGR